MATLKDIETGLAVGSGSGTVVDLTVDGEPYTW